MQQSQFLTAVIELRPSRRKAAALERVRAAAEDVFWRVAGGMREQADVLAAEADPGKRRVAWREAERRINAAVIAACRDAGLAEPVVQGLCRDLVQQTRSYVELRAAGHDAKWPVPVGDLAPDHVAALDRLLRAGTREEENAGRDALAAVARQPGPRPLVLARARDANLVRKTPTGGIMAVLNVLRASDRRARAATVQPGVEAAGGKEFHGTVSRTKLVIPVSCSAWHEHKFLSGRATLRSSLIVRRDERWFMCAQFEFPVRRMRMAGTRLGVDRGVVNPVAAAAVAADGRVTAVLPPAGSEIGQNISAADEKRGAEQKRRGTTSHRHAERVGHALHSLANAIVGAARERGAEVVVERLGGLKQTIVEARPKGSRKGGWRRALKRAQLGKLEEILRYKLALAGLPPAREVVAAGTSITCPACAVSDRRNRTEQSRFSCIGCGFTAHADSVGAVNIARRGLAMQSITKGAKLAPIEGNMVARLRSRGDGGLGPLAGDFAAAGGFVAAHAAADPANEGHRPLTGTAGQNNRPRTQNANNRVFAERSAAISSPTDEQKGAQDQGTRR